MVASVKSVTAFPEGNSIIAYENHVNSCFVGNPLGLIKVYDQTELDGEPKSIDINENLTSISVYRGQAVVTTSQGDLEIVNLGELESRGSIHRSELPLRDAIFINEGKRIVAGGDEPQLVIADLAALNAILPITLPNLMLNVSYNAIGEMIAVSLLNQAVQIYSVINESPSLLETLDNYVPEKVYTTMEGPLSDEELVCCKTSWSPNGEVLFVPNNKSVNAYLRSNFRQVAFTVGELDTALLDFDLSVDGKYIAMITSDSLSVYSVGSKTELFRTDISNPINVKWGRLRRIFVGYGTGLYGIFEDSFVDEKGRASALIDDAAEEENADDILDFDSETDELENGNGLDHIEDAGIIDEEDDSNVEPNHDTELDSYLESRKKQKTNGHYLNRNSLTKEAKPFSQGSTPWSDASAQSRRYLTMNTVGYTWVVKSGNSGENQSVTVSFFDRAKNRDYHFTDYSAFDLCLMNGRGLLMANLGYDGKKVNRGKLFYRSHESLQDSWEETIPLLDDEIITSITLTSDDSDMIVVGTSHGYMRFFNIFGVCVFLMRSSPVVALISSGVSLFSIGESSSGGYTYSIIGVNEDYRFIQQEIPLNLQHPNGLKGLFFNENNDPCIISGGHNTLLILSGWRETGNAKWIPLIHVNDAVTEGGKNDVKRHWHAWPLGLYQDEVSVLILKSGSKHPGFPLPLPVDIQIKLPVGGGEDQEEFLRSMTMGKIVSTSLADVEDDSNLMLRLEQYSIAFDRSLLKLFASLCQEALLSKANSIARLMKTDKALFAALKIAERMEYISLAGKIAKLREALLEE